MQLGFRRTDELCREYRKFCTTDIVDVTWTLSDFYRPEWSSLAHSLILWLATRWGSIAPYLCSKHHVLYPHSLHSRRFAWISSTGSECRRSVLFSSVVRTGLGTCGLSIPAFPCCDSLFFLTLPSIPPHPASCAHNSSAGVATSSAELVLVVASVVAVTWHTRRRHVDLLHAVDGGARRVVLRTDLVPARVGSVVKRWDFGDVLAVRLAVVLDSLAIVLARA